MIALPISWRVVMVGVLLGAVSLLDLLTGFELSFSVFYLAPIVLATWYLGRHFGYLLCATSALCWYAVDVSGGHAYSHPAIPVWNMAVRLGFFVITAHLLLRLRAALKLQAHLAQRDGLTGLMNGRTFMTQGERIIQLARRHGHPLAIAYLDLDGFKMVNDRFGHARGNEVLEGVAKVMAGRFRDSDLLARMGGDEFAALCPQTDLAGAAHLFDELHHRLSSAAVAQGWAVDFSIGVAVFDRAPESLEDGVRAADQLMYRIKKGDKGRFIVERVETTSPQMLQGLS